MPDYSGVTWRVNYGEIAESEQFRVGYVGMESYDAYFPVAQLSDLIATLNAVMGLGLEQVSRGTNVQAKKVSDGLITDVVIQPRLDTGDPAATMRLRLTDLADFLYALGLFQSALFGSPSPRPDDWDISLPNPLTPRQIEQVTEAINSDPTFGNQFATQAQGTKADLAIPNTTAGRANLAVAAETLAGIDARLAPIVVYVDAVKYPAMLTDAGATLAAIAAATPAGSTIEVCPGTYPSSGMLVPAKNMSYVGDGVTLVRTHPSAVLFAVEDPFEAQIPVSGISFTTTPILGRNTGVTVLTYASAPGYSPRDKIKLIADDLIPGGRQPDLTSFPRMGEVLSVVSVSGNTVTCVGYPIERAKYVTNLRTARMSRDTVAIRGFSFDISDTIAASAGTGSPMTSAAVLRVSSLVAPRIDNVEVRRALGPCIQIRSCVDAVLINPRIGEGSNNDSTILGYGVQDNGSKGTQIFGGSAWFVRHAYDDKSTDVIANSTNTAGYGRTLMPRVVAMSAWNTSSASFSTHQESYGVCFEACTVVGTGISGGFSLRGYGHKVDGCYASNVNTGVTVATETDYATGETRAVHVSDLTVEDAILAVQANIHLGTLHVSAGQQDTERNLTVDGLLARRVSALTIIQNARVSISNYQLQLADNPSVNTIDFRNSELLLGGSQWIDGLNVTVSPSTSHSLIKAQSPVESVSIRNRIVNTGQIHFDPSGYFAGRFSGGLFVPDANTDVDFSAANSLNIYTFISGGILPSTLTYRKQFTFGWRYVPHDDNTNRFAGSGEITATNSQISGTTAVRVLTSAPNDTLLLVVSMTDGTSRTLATLPSGRRRGQLLRILVTAAASEQLTVRHGSTGGTTLTGSTDRVLGNSGQLRLFWAGSSWREEA